MTLPTLAAKLINRSDNSPGVTCLLIQFSIFILQFSILNAFFPPSTGSYTRSNAANAHLCAKLLRASYLGDHVVCEIPRELKIANCKLDWATILNHSDNSLIQFAIFIFQFSILPLRQVLLLILEIVFPVLLDAQDFFIGHLPAHFRGSAHNH